MKTLGVIPARFGSTRLPGKPLLDIGGVSMVMRVYARAGLSALDEVVVATDDQRIFRHCQENGAKVMMTSPDHPDGTSRCAEVAGLWGQDFGLVVNLQGDEPFVEPEDINIVLALLKNGKEIATLAKPFDSMEDVANPNRVKVVFDLMGKALYFSRSPIPYSTERKCKGPYHQHIGLYGFQRHILLELRTMDSSPLSTNESLEQLKWMEHGKSIYVGLTTHECHCVDTIEDLQKIMKIYVE